MPLIAAYFATLFGGERVFSISKYLFIMNHHVIDVEKSVLRNYDLGCRSLHLNKIIAKTHSLPEMFSCTVVLCSASSCVLSQ